MKKISLCMICDSNYIMPTSVAIESFIMAKKDEIIYDIYIITSLLSEKECDFLCQYTSESVKINIIERNAEEMFGNIHVFHEDAICVATIAALLKFEIPNILSDLDKVLYIDGDLISKISLDEVYAYDIENVYAGVVIDSGSIYYKHEYVRKVDSYFNSGVMLLNLKKMRTDNITEKLIETKKNLKDSSLMDQNVFNLVFNGKVKLLPIKYNFLAVNLDRSYEKWSIEDINHIYGTMYANKKELFEDAKIIHYSSTNKPWKDPDCACSNEWLKIANKRNKGTLVDKEKRLVSVIIPCYNLEKYILATLKSIYEQTYDNIEIICIDDGSSDNTLDILYKEKKDHLNMIVVSNENHHQGYERNYGLNIATGTYVYFMDGDDILAPNCIECLVQNMEINRLDCILFEGESFYEEKELEEEFPQYRTVYKRNNAYTKVYKGRDLYIELRRRGEFIVSPCMQMVRRDFLLKNNVRFLEIAMLEDNKYTFDVLLAARRVKCLSDSFFYRRVRRNSTMTQKNIEEKIVAWICVIKSTFNSIGKYKDDKELYSVIRQHITAYIKNVYDLKNKIDIELWESVLADETEEFKILIENEYRLYMLESNVRNQCKELKHKENIINMKCKDLQPKCEENRFLESEIIRITNSYTYKIGSLITFVPRKARRLILKCCNYCLKRIKKK